MRGAIAQSEIKGFVLKRNGQQVPAYKTGGVDTAIPLAVLLVDIHGDRVSWPEMTYELHALDRASTAGVETYAIANLVTIKRADSISVKRYPLLNETVFFPDGFMEGIVNTVLHVPHQTRRV